MQQEVVIRVSNRHVHLSKADLETLFGEGYELTIRNYLGASKVEFAANETVTVVGPKGKLEKVRVLGPCRKATQVELLRSDCFKIGVDAPMRNSGDTAGSAPLELIAPNGNSIKIAEGGIIALRHIHVGKDAAEAIGVHDGDMVDVHTTGPRSVVFEKTFIRCGGSSTTFTMHIDVDESNSAGLSEGVIGWIEASK